MSNDRLVSDHYDTKKQVSISDRKKSKIFQLRSFNNWVKIILINKYTRRGDRCVDMCCGTGGDLKKWNRARIEYLLCVDNSAASVTECEKRYHNERRNVFTADFFTVNCFSSDFMHLSCFHSNRNFHSFDVVSIQFAYHYAFSTKETVGISLQNISSCLKKDGIFMATIPDSNVIAERIKKASELSFGNDLYQVEFKSKEPFLEYGQEYIFYLYETINYLPEYMVCIESLRSLALEYGLELIYQRNFADFFQEHKNDYQHILLRMLEYDSFPGSLPMSSLEWEIATLYTVIVFKKIT